MHAAVWSMCGSGSIAQRLSDAGLNLHTLADHDLDGELRQDLVYVLNWTTRNSLLDEREVKKLPDDLELRSLIEKMLRILLETYRE